MPVRVTVTLLGVPAVALEGLMALTVGVVAAVMAKPRVDPEFTIVPPLLLVTPTAAVPAVVRSAEGI